MSDNGFGGRVLQSRMNLAARKGRPVTQVEVAKAMDVSSATVGRWEANLKEPNLETIARLARVLEVDPGWLAFGTEGTGKAPVEPSPSPRTAESYEEKKEATG